MKHSFLAPLLAVVAALLAGCEICQGPFDYCGPVIGPGGCPNCDWQARAGSAFHPFDDQPLVGRTSPAPAAVPGATGGQYRRSGVPADTSQPAEAEATGALEAEDFPALEDGSQF